MSPKPAPPDHFSRLSTGYAAFRPTYPDELVDFLAEVAPRREIAWEAGCGSGQLTLSLARRFALVAASDASRMQLARAPSHPSVGWHAATAEACALTGGVVDLAVSAQAAHWFDLPRYYAEVRRVTREGGVVALVSYGVMAVEDRIDSVVRGFHDRVLAPHWPPERREVTRGYRSLPFPFPELPAPDFEITMERALDEVMGYVESWSAVQSLVDSGGTASLDRFRETLTEAWGVPEIPRTVRWPLSLRVGRVTAPSGSKGNTPGE
jgi:SAM-dependent methyltransferase